ncbi:hypothetical protein PAMP_009474 [Pampus punctatissimus]
MSEREREREIAQESMEMLWSLYVLVFLFSVPAAHSHRDPQGLSCVNDFVNNISCTWSGSPVGPGVDCWIFGLKKTYFKKDNTFNRYEVIQLSMKCNGTVVENLTNYNPSNHIKMHPPGVPNVSSTDNETLISWSPGSPISSFIKAFDFQVQIKQSHQTWKEAKTLFTQDQKQTIPALQLKGTGQKWLNPVSESFFTAQPCDKISPVEVCESWDVVRSTLLSSSSTSPLLYFRSYPLADSDTSRVDDNSASSISSCFSNMGYFMSSSSSSSARDDHSPGYFIHHKDFRNVHNSHNLHLSLCPSFTSTYERLKKGEPQSPDSGFGIGKEDEEDKEDERDVVGEKDDHQSTPLHILPVHLFSQMPPASTAPPPLHPPSLTQISTDSQQEDVTVAVASGSCAGWPVASSMYRSSSVPVETCKTGYLTLKELQTTFSNKSI